MSMKYDEVRDLQMKFVWHAKELVDIRVVEIAYSHGVTSLIDWKMSPCSDAIVVNNWKIFLARDKNTLSQVIFGCCKDVYRSFTKNGSTIPQTDKVFGNYL